MLKFGLFATAFSAAIGLGLFLNNGMLSKLNSDMTVKNLRALEVSAGEQWCDQSTQSSCIISIGGVTGTSKGLIKTSN